MFEECIRCSEAPAVDDFGLCGHCHWVVAAEVKKEVEKTFEEGFLALCEYLYNWLRFSIVCEAKGLKPC